jgi:hypothetical protein
MAKGDAKKAKGRGRGRAKRKALGAGVGIAAVALTPGLAYAPARAQGSTPVSFSIADVSPIKSTKPTPFTEFELQQIAPIAEPLFIGGVTIYEGKLFTASTPPSPGVASSVPFFTGELFQEPNTTTWAFEGSWNSSQPVPDPTNQEWSFKGELETGSGG